MHIDIDWVNNKVLVDERFSWTPERAIKFATELTEKAEQIAEYRDRVAKRDRLFKRLDDLREQTRKVEQQIAEV